MIPKKKITLNRNKEITISAISIVIITVLLNFMPPTHFWILKVLISTGYVFGFIYLTTLKDYKAYLFIAAIGFYALANIIELQEQAVRSSDAHPFYIIGHLLMISSIFRYFIYNQFKK